MSSKGKYGSRSGNAILTEEGLRARHRKEDSDAYLFDVEYEKLKKEREETEKELEQAREEYLRVSEELRQEMINGTASDAAMERFSAVLTERGVQLQQEQEQLQKNVSDMQAQQADVENRMNELRMKAFGGNTRAWNSANKNADYKGFKLDGDKRYANAKLVEMSPQEYLRRIAFDIKGNGLDEVLKGASPAQVEKYMRQMLRGTRFNAPTLNYKNGTTIGDARALAALFNGYKRIPVMVVE